MTATVVELFRAQAARSPDAIAVDPLTYRELAARADRLSRALAAAGVGVEDRVGVSCARSADLIVAVLGVIGAGAAYVPVEPAWPRARRDLVLDDAAIRIVVTQRALAAGFAIDTICVDEPLDGPRFEVALAPSNALCVLYTSGSTGRPKGVVIEHRAIASRLAWAEEVYPYGAGEVASARTPLGFVDSVAEIFAPLACGVPLVMMSDDAQRDPARLIDELAACAATRVVLVPSLLETLFAIAPDLGARLPALRYWFVGGEPVPVPLVDRFFAAMPGRKLVNIYGATEVSGDATWFDFDRMPPGLASAPIGIPLRGCHARVVDDELRPLGPGEIGAVAIGGVCLARGYLDRPALTAERFVRDGGERLYLTGDLGRTLPSGDIQYLGRADQQVKIRGVRVELGEVEAAIAGLPGAGQVAAVAAGGVLVAYYTGGAGPDALRAAVAVRVPDALIPTHLIRIDALPVAPSGKLDRRALRERPIELATAAPGDAPASSLEREVAAAWQSVLGLSPIGRSQRFDHLGGTSLAAARIAAALRDRCGVDLPIAALYAHPTVAALAAEIARLPRVRAAAPARLGRAIPPVLPLGHHQLPFWFFAALTGDVSVVTEVFGVDGDLDVERLQRAYAATVASFDALWMRIPRWRPVQRLAPRAPCRFEVRRAGSLQAEVDACATARFDLERPPLCRARLVELPGGDRRLIVTIPHVVVDMTSMERFRRGLEARYHGETPPSAEATLADLAAWEREPPRPADLAHWRDAPSIWNPVPARLIGRAGERAVASRTIPPGPPIDLVAAIGAGVGAALEHPDPTLLLMLEKRDRPGTRDLFTTLASLMPVKLGDRPHQRIVAGLEHAAPLLRRPALWHDAWRGAPAPARALIRRLGALLARRWPDAALDPESLGDHVFALLPYRLPPRAVAIAVNVLPEVHEPPPPPRAGLSIVRRRTIEQLLRPDDLVIGRDRFLSRTLQIHLTRAPGGPVVVNLYGGSIHQAGLDEIAARIAEAPVRSPRP